MCDAFASNYAAQINSFTPVSADLQPTLVLFDSFQCGGSFYPTTASSVPSNPFTQGQVLLQFQDFPFTIASLFVPFNFASVTFMSAAGNSSTYIGPVMLNDLQFVRYQLDASGQPSSSVPDMYSDPIYQITITTLTSWTTEVFDMCLGETRYVDGFPLARYYPQSERCDYFMSNQFCNNASLAASHPDACACLLELPGLEAESKKLGVTLPVVCFGQKCATQRSYKTNNMMSQPCNLTICQQIISSTPGVVDQGQDTIFCGGQFFKANGTLVAPSVTPLPAPSNAQQSGTPFYVWVMLGVSAALFVVLIVLLFSEKPPKEVGVLRQLRKIQKQRQIYNLSNLQAVPRETPATVLINAEAGPPPVVDY